jgi:O-antigen/teichoic acid export membrane protein
VTQSSERSVAVRTISGSAWLTAARLTARAVDFVSLLTLARFLLPTDFGLVAVALTLVQIVEAVLEIPVGQVLVRSEAITRDLLDTAFTISLLRGLLLAAAVGICAEPFSFFYHDSRLVWLLLVLSIAPVARGLASPAMVRFAKKIDFRRDLIIEFSAKIVAMACSVTLAVTTRSYWAIAAGTVAGPLAMMSLSYAFAPHRPRLTLSHWSSFAHFVGWSTASQLVTALNWQIDRLLLGRFVSKTELGAFSLAGDLAAIPEQALVSPISRSLLAAFAAVGQERDRLADAYSRAATAMLTIGLPVMLGLSLLAEPAVRLALGPKWQMSVPMLQWLALTLIAPLFTSPLKSLAMAVGRTDVFLRRNVLELSLTVPVVAAGAYWYGVGGVIAARMAISVVMALVATLLVRQLIQLPIRRQLAGPWRAACAGAGMTIVLLAARNVLHGFDGLRLAIGLAACGGIGVATYSIVLLLLWRLDGRPNGVETTLLGIVGKRWPRLQALLA